MKSSILLDPVPENYQRGASLVEIMIAVLLVSLGLIGVVRMQVGSMRNAENTYMQSQASLLAYTMLDALRADRTGARQNAYDMAKTCTITPSAGGLVSEVQRHWLQSIKTVLGDTEQSCGEVQCAASQCRVRVYWDDSRATSGADSYSIELQTQI